MRLRNHGKRIVATGLSAAAALLLAVPSYADCKSDLAKLTREIGQAEGLDEARSAMLTSMRDMAATLCAQGQEKMAQQLIGELRTQLDQLGAAPGGDAPRSSAQAASTSLPKSKLTVEYLEGMWCMSSSRHERVYPIEFKADGSHLVGQPAGGKIGMFPNGDELDDFYRSFDQVVSMSKKRFVVTDRREVTLTYDRGKCAGMEIAR